MSSGFRVTLLVDRRPLRTTEHHGTTYALAAPGRAFEVAISHSNNATYMVRLEVDGVETQVWWGAKVGDGADPSSSSAAAPTSAANSAAESPASSMCAEQGSVHGHQPAGSTRTGGNRPGGGVSQRGRRESRRSGSSSTWRDHQPAGSGSPVTVCGSPSRQAGSQAARHSRARKSCRKKTRLWRSIYISS